MPPGTSTSDIEQKDRQAWMQVLSAAVDADLMSCWQAVAERIPPHQVIREPEVGLLMVRARISGTGSRFNLGEMPVTRCSVRLETGAVGHAYIAGRRPHSAKVVAIIDAALQTPGLRDVLVATVLQPLEAQERSRQQSIARKVAATKVDFLTLARQSSMTPSR